MSQTCIILLCYRQKIAVVWLSRLIMGGAAYVSDIDILPGRDIILYKVDLILFVM